MGGSNDDYGCGVSVELDENCYVIGYTFSSNFPTKNAYDNTLSGEKDAFVIKFILPPPLNRRAAYAFLGTVVVIIPIIIIVYVVRKRRKLLPNVFLEKNYINSKIARKIK